MTGSEFSGRTPTSSDPGSFVTILGSAASAPTSVVQVGIRGGRPGPFLQSPYQW